MLREKLAIANAKHHKKSFSIHLKHWTSSRVSGIGSCFIQWKQWTGRLNMEGMNSTNSESVINTKCQGRGEGFLFWSIEPSTTLIQQHHYSIYSSCEENIYSGKALSQGLTAEETVLGRKVFHTVFLHSSHSHLLASVFSPQSIQ